MVWAAADPWLCRFGDPVADFDRENALRILFEEVNAIPDVEVLPFLGDEFWEGFSQQSEDAKKDLCRRRGLMEWLGRLTVRHPPPNDAHTVAIAPSPDDLVPAWLAAVTSVFVPDDPDRWRDPVVLVPARRRPEWTVADEVALSLASGQADDRVLATIEMLHEHPSFDSDLDPWLCEDTPGRRNVDRVARRLPRPPELVRQPLRRWREIIDGLPDHGFSADGTRLFFIPPPKWFPATVPKALWHGDRRPFGAHGHKSTKRGPKSGPRDAYGRVWSWDASLRHRTHWDVEHEDEHKLDKYMNVRPDGLITKHYDD